MSQLQSAFVQTEVDGSHIQRSADGDFLLQADGSLAHLAGIPDVQMEGGEEDDQQAQVAPTTPPIAGGESATSAGTTNNAKSQQEAGAAGGAAEGAEGEGPVVQTKRESGGGGGASNQVSLSRYLDSTSGSGGGLDSATNQRMSESFGHDFSGVQVHNDSAANSVCRSLGANAFATGRDVYFAQGRYNPGTREGDRLLAHELTHVVQQSGGGVGRSIARKGISFSTPGDPYEREADAVADVVTDSLYRSKSDDKPVARHLSADADGPALPTVSLAQAIVQRKIAGVPDVQMDVGVVLGIVGVAVSVGAWIYSVDNSRTLKVDPNMNWVAPRGDARNRYRSAHPFQWKSWKLVSAYWDVQWPRPNESWDIYLKWRYNGAELLQVELDQAYSGHWLTSSSVQLKVFDDQSTSGRLGFQLEAEVDPTFAGYFKTSFRGWLGVDGAGSRNSYSWSS